MTLQSDACPWRTRGVMVGVLLSGLLGARMAEGICVHQSCRAPLLAVSEPDAGPTNVPALPLSAQRHFSQAKAFYRHAVDGNAEARAQAVTLLTPLVVAHPTHAGIRVYFGSLRLLEARSTINLWRKYHLSREGLEFLDTAVAQAPDDPEVRCIRGITTYHLPRAANRGEQAAEDLHWVARHASAAVANGQLDSALAAAALYYHGLCREARGDGNGAAAAWREAYALAPTSRSGQQAARKLHAE